MLTFFDLRSNWLSIILHVEQKEGVKGLMVLSLFLQFLDIVFIPSTYSLICWAGNTQVWRLSQLLPSKPVTSLAVALYVFQVAVFSTSSGTHSSLFIFFFCKLIETCHLLTSLILFIIGYLCSFTFIFIASQERQKVTPMLILLLGKILFLILCPNPISIFSLLTDSPYQ